MAVSSFLGSCNQLTGTVVRRLLYYICYGRTEVRDRSTCKSNSRLAKFWLADTCLYECIILVLLIDATENAYILILLSGKLLQVVSQ